MRKVVAATEVRRLATREAVMVTEQIRIHMEGIGGIQEVIHSGDDAQQAA